MQKSLDPMSVERTETPSASYVLKRRYGPSRFVIVTASWITVLNMFLQPLAALAGTVTWDANGATSGLTDGAGAWKDADKWWTGSANQTWVSGDDAIFGNGGAGGTVTLASPTTVNSLTLNSFTGTYTVGTAAQTITLNMGITMNSGAGAVTIISPVTLGGSQSWTHNDDSLLTVGTGAFSLGGYVLTIAGSGNTAISSIISTAGSLVKTDAGTLTLSGVNTFTGALILGSGTIKANTSASALGAGILALGGGTLDFNDTATRAFNRATTIFGNTTITVERDTGGDGVGVAYTSTGALTIGANTLNLGGGNVTSGTAGLTYSGATTLNGNATFNITKPGGTGTTLLTLAAITGYNNSLTLQGTGNFAQTGVWSGAGSSLVLDTAYSGLATLSGANTFTGGVTINTTSGGIVKLTSSAAAAGVGPVSFSASSTGKLQTQFGATVYGISSAAIGSVIENGSGSAYTLTVNNPIASTFAGVIQDGSTGALALTVGASGNGGALTLSGTSANTYTGLTTISAGGQLNIQKATALGGTGNGTSVTSNGALQIQGGITTSAEALTLNGTGFLLSSYGYNTGALRNISGANTYAGVITLGAASRINSDGGTLTIDSAAGDVTGNFGLTFGGAGDIVLADRFAPATAAQTITKDGTGTVTLTALNTYTGANTVQNGILRADAANNLVFNTANALTFNGGTFQYDNNNAGANRAQSLGALTFTSGDGNVQLIKTGANSVKITFASLAARTAGATGNFVWSGTSDVDNGIWFTTITSGFQNQGEFFNGNNYAWVHGTQPNYVRGINYGTDANTVSLVAGTEIGAGDASKHIQLTGAMSGQTARTILTLNIAGAYDFTLASGTVTLTNGGILKGGGGSSTISGGTAVTGASNIEYVIRTDTSSDTLIINTPITATGANALTKSGAGTLTLGAANTYTGNVSVNGGTLSIGANGHLGAVNSTKTITLTGGSTLQLTGNIDFYNGAPGTNPRAFTIGYGGATIDTGANTATISGVLSSSGAVGIGPLTKTGNGTLILSGANTLTSGLYLNQGNLVATVAGGFGTSGNTLFFNGGNLELRAAATIYTGRTDMTAAGTTITINPAGPALGNGVTHTISGIATLGTQTMVVQKGSLTNADTAYGLTFSTTPILTGNPTFTINGNGTAAGTLTFSGGFDVQGQTRTLTFNAGTGSGVAVVGGALSGTAGTLELAGTVANVTVNALTGTANNLKLSGSGTYLLQGTSTYTGNTILNNASANVIGTIAGAFGSSGRIILSVAPAGLEFRQAAGATAGTTFTSGLDTTTAGAPIVINRTDNPGTATTHTLNQVNFLGSNMVSLSAGANITSGIAYGLTLTGANVLTGNPTFTINGNGAGIGTLTLSGGFDVQGTTRTITFNGATSAAVVSGAFVGAPGTLELTGTTSTVTVNALTGVYPWNLKLSGSGTYYLAGASTYTGNTILNYADSTYYVTAAGGLGGSSVGRTVFAQSGITLNLRAGTTTFTSGLDLSSNSATVKVEPATGPLPGVIHTLSGLNLLANTLTMNPGSLTDNNTAYGLTLSGASTLVGNTILQINNNGSSGVGTLTLSGVVCQSGGSSGLIKNGDGTLTFSGASTFTGGVTLNSGTLKYGLAGTAGTSGPLGNGGTFTINGGTLDTNGATITGLNVTPITLNGDFAYSTSTGTAALNTLTIPGAITMAADRTITLNGLGALTLSGLLTNTGDSVRTLTVNKGTGAGTTSILTIGSYNLTGPGSSSSRINVINGTGQVTISGIVADGVSAGSGLTYNGSGTLTLSGANTFSGGLNVQAGTLKLNNTTAASVGAVTIGSPGNSATLDLYGGSRTISGLLTTAGTAANQTITSTVVSGVLNYTGPTTSFGGAITGGANTAVTLNNASTILTLSGANNYNGTTTITAGTLVLAGSNSGTGATTLTAGTLQFAGSTSNPLASGTLTLTSGTVEALNAGHVINNNTILTGVTVSGSNSLEFSGNFINHYWTASLTSSITGNNVLTLSGNVYLTDLAANGGTLEIAGMGSTTISGAIANYNGVGADGKLTIKNTGTTTISGANSYSGLTTMNAATGTLVLSGSNSSAGGTTLTTGTLQFGGASVNPLASGTLTLNGGTVQALNAGHVIGNNTTIGGSIVFSGANALEFSGPVMIDPDLTITNSIDPGNTLTFSNTFRLGNTTQRTMTLAGTGNTTFSGAITQPAVGAALTITNTGTTTLSAANTYTGTTTFSGGTVVLTGSGVIANGSGMSFNGGVLAGTGTFGTSGSAIFGGERVLGTGAGKVTLAGANGGGFAAYGGTLDVALGAATWASTTYFYADNAPMILGSTVADNVVTWKNNIALNGAIREIKVLDNTGSTADKAVIEGILSGNVFSSVNKTGAGVLEFKSGVTHTYGGRTTITAGTLLVSGTLDSQTSAVTVKSGATLGGTGTINRPVTVENGGTIAPGGSSIGTLTVSGNLTLNNASISGFEVNASDSTRDQITGITALTYGGTLKITKTAGTFASGNSWKLFTFSSKTGTFDNHTVFGTAGDGTNLPTLAVGLKWMFDYDTGTLSIETNVGPLDHFAISTIASPQTAGTPITGITLTAQDANNLTVTSFDGAGSTVSYSGTAGISGTSGNFVSGVLSGVSVTPTTAGSSLTFIVTGPAGSGSKTGTATITTINPGSLDHFAISTITSPQVVGTPIAGITLTAQDANNNTVTSFNGAGNTVTYSGTAGITGTSGNFVSGELSGVSVTPTVAGNNVTFIVTGPVGSGSKTGTATITVNSRPGTVIIFR